MFATWSTRHGNQQRNALLRLIKARPGLHKSALGRHLDTSWGNIGHHLERLRAEGKIRPFRNGRRLHWFACDVPSRFYFALSLLHEPQVPEAITALRGRAGLDTRGLADELEVTMKVARRIVRDLEQAGLLSQGRSGLVFEDRRLPDYS